MSQVIQYLPVVEEPQLVGGTAEVREKNGFAIYTTGKRPSGTNPVGLNPDSAPSIKANTKASGNLLPVIVVLPDDVPIGRLIRKNDMVSRHGEETPVYDVLDGAKVPADILDEPLCNGDLIG